jgi:hypothetical protein
MSVLEEQIKMWEENSKKSFANVLTQIDNEFRKVIAPTKDEYGFENTPISWLKMNWTMEENADNKMIEYVGRLLMVLNDFDFISIKSNKIIIEDEPLKSLIAKIRKISSFKKEHIEETVRLFNL